MCDRAVHTAPAAVCLSLILTLFTCSDTLAQVEIPETVGFGDPARVGSIYDYRLPDWGYRTNSFALDALGRGSYAESDVTRATAEIDLQSFGHRESERGVRSAWVRFGGAFEHQRTELDGESDERTAYSADVRTDIEQLHYFGPQVAWTNEIRVQVAFQETRGDRISSTRTARDARVGLGAGLAFGRLREVTPVVRAERISERLLALGRRPLARTEVLRLARQLAQRQGYERVYRRQEKYFWPPLLDEIAGDRLFTPLEVLYLTEVLDEALVVRRQGLRVDLGIQGTHYLYDKDDLTEVGPTAGITWSRNLDLHHQFSAHASGSFLRQGRDLLDEIEAERWLARARLRYDWLIADRFTWTHEIQAAYSRGEFHPGVPYGDGIRFQQESEVTTWEFTSTADYFVVDRWSVRPSVRVEGRSTRHEDSRQPEAMATDPWSWSARLALVYTSNRILR